MTWLVLRRERLPVFFGGPPPAVIEYDWTLVRVDGGIGTAVSSFSDGAVAERIAALLNRHGMADVPLTGLETS